MTQIDLESTTVETASEEFLGRWNRLVSTTNWEKGRIICDWRAALEAADAPAATYTDDAWARRVGNVSPQHTGRLRRVWERFGDQYGQYAGLYWSHFQAALDWPDAEMWLEGALQNQWSIAQMRNQRWESMGAPADLKPRPEDIIEAELDEDVSPADDTPRAESIPGTPSEVQDTDPDSEAPFDSDASGEEFESPTTATAVDPRRPFEGLPALPPDLDEAFESLKLAILSHRMTGWDEVPQDAVLRWLEAMRCFALAPADEG
ncbi:MAG: hypothetical protein RBS80_15175 [Thermoguttaceae bacterium]|jgi:hypothetical protein|nr:hypothetical protein [Thermoguttaceae bacterium]